DFHEDIDPTDEARDRRLKRESKDEGDQAKRNDGGVPVREHDGKPDENYDKSDEQISDAVKIVTGHAVVQRIDQVVANKGADSEDQDYRRSTKRDSLKYGNVPFAREIEIAKCDEIVEGDGGKKDDQIGPEKELLPWFDFSFLLRLASSSLVQ